MCLAIYAKKSGISKEELEKDAFALFDFMEDNNLDWSLDTIDIIIDEIMLTAKKVY